MRPGDDLAARLNEREERQSYRRQRAVRQFSHRLRIGGVLAGVLAALLFYVLSLAALRLDLELPSEIAFAIFALTWLYLVLLPLLFALRTRLFAYVLQEHWMWLAAWLALPIDWFFIRMRTSQIQWLPILFLLLLALGQVLRRWRQRRFSAELEAHVPLWECLLPLDVLDLVTFGFWNAR